MTDSNKHDPIEELFQKKAGDYDISYKEEDWRKLEDRLDSWDAQNVTRRRRRLVAAAVILLVSVLAYFTYQNYQQLNSLEQQITQNEDVITSLPEIEGDIQNEIDSEQSDNEDSSGPESVSEETEKTNEEATSPATTDNTAEETSTVTETTKKLLEGTTDKLERVKVQYSKTNLTTLNQKSTFKQITLKSVDSPSNSGSGTVLPSKTPTPYTASKSIGKDRKTPKASIGFVLGPDMSTVGSVSNFHNPGYKLGLTIDYNISRNLSLSVGAIHSSVRYQADGKEYHPPENYWNYGIHADHTVGECLLIDIPINLSYRFLHFDQSRMYASAGFSSYIMLNEDYRFSYDSNQSGLPQRWNQKTGTTYFMSNLSLSIGYELDISQKFSLRAEPFIKMPIKKVGWGNVNLYSVGSLISINYHLQ